MMAGEIVNMVDHMNHLQAEVAALRKENELLHQWLTQQKEVNSSLYDMISIVRKELILTRGDSK
jgi:hypothetical protein